MLQEVCDWQASQMYYEFGTQYNVYWRPIKNRDSSCPQIGDFVGVKTSYQLLGTENVDLPDGGSGGNIGMMCVIYLRGGIGERACSTHLPSTADPDPDIRKKDTAEIKRVSSIWISQGYRVIIGGDFNTPPTGTAMASMYDVNGNGSFNEADQLWQCPSACRTGRPTHLNGSEYTNKLDYVFFSTNMSNRTSGLSASLNAWQAYSDHKLLEGALG